MRASRGSSRVRRFLFEDGGAALVEMALVAGVIFLPMVFGIVEVGRGIWIKSTITAAAREGVRYAIVHGSESGATADSAAVANWVISKSGLSGLTVRPTWPSGNKDPGSIAQVNVTYNFVSLIPVVPSKTISSTSRQVISF